MRVETPPSPSRLLRDRVEAEHVPGDRLTVITDAQSYPDRVLVGVRLPTAAFVMTIARREYDGLKLMNLLGFPDAPEAPRPDAMTRALAQKGKQ